MLVFRFLQLGFVSCMGYIFWGSPGLSASTHLEKRYLSVFVDRSFSGLNNLSVSQYIQQQHPGFDLSNFDILSIEALIMGKGSIAVQANDTASSIVDIDQENYIDFVDLKIPAPVPKNALWTIWFSGELYFESFEMTVQVKPSQSLPKKVFCPGAWGNVNFTITEPFSAWPKVEVVGTKNYVWVMTGFGDRNSGPWLANYPKRDNFKGGAQHWKVGSENHWLYNVPRTYPSTGFEAARVYFMANAAKDSPYIGDIVDWCDLTN